MKTNKARLEQVEQRAAALKPPHQRVLIVNIPQAATGEQSQQCYDDAARLAGIVDVVIMLPDNGRGKP